METILIITKKEMFSDSSRNYIRNKVRKFKNPFFDISFNLIYNIYCRVTNCGPNPKGVGYRPIKPNIINL